MRFILFALLSAGPVASAQTTVVVPDTNFTTTASGLQYAVTFHGGGEVPQPGQVVIAHYVGTLSDGTVFDSSRTRNQPFGFTLGKKQVIKGWEEGFALLHVGDKATFVIPPKLAYGAKDRGNIPSNSTLRFDVELLAVKEGGLADALQETLDRDGLTTATMHFADWKAGGFSRLYPDESQLNNLGYYYLQAGKLPEALAVLRWNVELFPNSANVYDSLGEALVKDGQADPAIANYEKSLRLDPKNANAEKVLAELRTGPDAVLLIRDRMLLEDALNAASSSAEKNEPVDLPALKARLVVLLDRNPLRENDAGLVRNFFYLVESIDLKQAAAEWEYFRHSSNEKIRELAEAKMGLAHAVKTPLEFKFLAIDGRDVDLSALRGKVVLVDFWATWCGPCRAEIPNIVATYEKYHAQGFEVIGISFDKAPDAAKPWKSAKTADEVAAFTVENKMPWPQFYDGKYWDNSFGQRFGIHAIPAMFLLDRNGMIVSLNARGAKLEREVKRLLGM